MTDLTDRIAAILRSSWRTWWRYGSHKQWAEATAAAIVAELPFADIADTTMSDNRSDTDINPRDCAYPRDYTDRQLLESVWRKIDGLAHMVAGPTRNVAEAHPDDIADVVAAWTRNVT